MTPRNSRRFKFTNAKIKALTATDRRGERWTDAMLAGLGVTVYPDGRKVFYLRYGARNRRRFLTLGPFGVLTVDKAREQAQDILARYRIRGEDPAYDLKRSREVPTFAQWVKTYLPRRQRLNPKSAGREVSYLEDAVEVFGGRALDEVGSEAIEEARLAVSEERGMPTSNRWLSALRACFRAAMATDPPLIARDPTQGIKLYNEKPGRRRPRELNDDELSRVLGEVDKLTDPYMRAVFLLLIATGVRKGEALSARWETMRLDFGEWRLIDTKSGDDKMKYLAEPVIAMLRSLPRIEGSPWVFPSRTNPKKHMTAIDAEWRALRVRAGVPGVIIHDLRRTFGDRMKRIGGLQVASEALGHAHITTTAENYAPAGEERIRGTLERVVGEVIPFPSTKNSSKRRTSAKGEG